MIQLLEKLCVIELNVCMNLCNIKVKIKNDYLNKF
jgi:hypothetical protein